jgi:hypothetical protein
MDQAAQISRLQTSAIALLIETHCIAREPVERWPVSLNSVKPPTDDDIEGTVEATFEGYRAVAIGVWNLISEMPAWYRRRRNYYHGLAASSLAWGITPQKTRSKSNPGVETKDHVRKVRAENLRTPGRGRGFPEAGWNLGTGIETKDHERKVRAENLRTPGRGRGFPETGWNLGTGRIETKDHERMVRVENEDQSDPPAPLASLEFVLLSTLATLRTGIPIIRSGPQLSKYCDLCFSSLEEEASKSSQFDRFDPLR